MTSPRNQQIARWTLTLVQKLTTNENTPHSGIIVIGTGGSPCYGNDASSVVKKALNY